MNRIAAVSRPAICLLLLVSPALASAADLSGANPFWSAVMLLVVTIATVASAALPVSALKHWTGYWRFFAAFPLVILAGWCVWIFIARLLSPAAHPYWLLEIFAWAMLTMLYMATLFTAKRQFEKADYPDQH